MLKKIIVLFLLHSHSHIMSSMYMYQGLGQMLTKCLQHHQGYPETPKSADVICERPLTSIEKEVNPL